MSVANTRHTLRLPIPSPLDSPGRRRERRRSAPKRLAVDVLEDRTLLAIDTIIQPTPAYTAGTHLIPITGADFSTTSSVTDGAETVSFSSPMSVRTVPGGGWASWASPPDTESSTPRVLFTQGLQSVTATFSQPVATFGAEVEPNSFGNFPITATFFNGASVIATRTIGVDGVAGARLFALSSTGATPLFTSVVFTAPAGASGFALAQIRYALPTADLSIVKTDAPDPVFAGNNIIYNIAITNNGPRDAPAYNLFDSVLGPVSFVSFNQTGGPALGSTLPVGATASFQLIAKVNPNAPAGAVVNNTATASSALPDLNTDNNIARTTTTVATSADLVVTKVGTPDPVVAGTNITYTITVANNGPSDAQAYNVNDVFPAGTTPLLFTPISGPPVGSTLPAGSSATFLAIARVNPSLAPGTIVVNTASATSTTPDPNPNNNVGTARNLVITSADLVVTKSANPNPVQVGGLLTYTLSLTNNGPSDARAVVLTDAIPAGTTFDSATGPPGWLKTTPPVGAMGNVEFKRDSIPVGSSFAFVMVVRLAPGTLTAVSNTVRVASSTPDPDPSNNSFTTSTPVVGLADLIVTKTAAPDPVTPGNNLTYTVIIKNVGTATALNVTFQDTLSPFTSFVSNSGAPGWVSTNPPVGSFGGTINSTTPSLAPGASATFTIVVKVPAGTTRGIVVTNIANATTISPEVDPHNISINQVTVGAPPPPTNPTPEQRGTTIGQTSLASPSKAATSATSSVSQAQDAALATSGGLVADVVRQKTLSGLLGFGN